MDYGHPERADRLAAEYTLGALRGGARRRFERLLPAHPALAAAVSRWGDQLQLLADVTPPVQPPDRVWDALQRQTSVSANESQMPDAERSRSARRGEAPRFWQGLSAVALAASLMLGAVLLRPVAPQAPVVVVLHGTPEGQSSIKTGFVASVSHDGQALVLKPLGPVTIDSAQALELWAVSTDGRPASLGLVTTGERATTVLRAGLLTGVKAFAVSLEPAGGSPSGAPTGPVISAGSVDAAELRSRAS